MFNSTGSTVPDAYHMVPGGACWWNFEEALVGVLAGPRAICWIDTAHQHPTSPFVARGGTLSRTRATTATHKNQFILWKIYALVNNIIMLCDVCLSLIGLISAAAVVTRDGCYLLGRWQQSFLVLVNTDAAKTSHIPHEFRTLSSKPPAHMPYDIYVEYVEYDTAAVFKFIPPVARGIVL